MKQQMQNKSNSQEVNFGGRQIRVDENRLYNLLFAGKITLKEYLKESRSKNK